MSGFTGHDPAEKRDGAGVRRPVRVGHISFLNCYPLYFGLEARSAPVGPGGPGLSAPALGRAPVEFELVPGVPTDLNRMLASGTIDFGPISSIAYARSARRLALSGRLSISSRGAVDSIQLVSTTPIERVERVALTPKSATSVAMLKSLLRLRYGLDVFYSELLTSPREALTTHDAVLLIGDEGLEAMHFPWWRGASYHRYDLGRLWLEWTGLPMVYAVWATRAEFFESRAGDIRAVEEELVRSVQHSRVRAGEVVESALGHYRFGRDCMTRYFEILHYGFGEEYRSGLRRFFEVAYEAGELEEVPALRFFDETEKGGTDGP